MLRACAAEFLGTFALLFFGCGSAVALHVHFPEAGAAGLLGVALAHAAVLVVAIGCFINHSGAQFNPAVSIALMLAGRQPPALALAYVGTQIFAAGSAAGMLIFLLGPDVADSFHHTQSPTGTRMGATIGSLTLQGRWGAVLLLEAIMTFALMIAILRGVGECHAHAPHDHPDRPPARLEGLRVGAHVGLTVAAAVMVAGPLTGASLNPARTLGPALYGHWDMHWVYWLGPVTGACAAAWVDRLLFTPHRSPAIRAA